MLCNFRVLLSLNRRTGRCSRNRLNLSVRVANLDQQIFGEVAVGKAAAGLLAAVGQTIRGFESLPSPPRSVQLHYEAIFGTVSE
jgi:hypothetical protein